MRSTVLLHGVRAGTAAFFLFGFGSAAEAQSGPPSVAAARIDTADAPVIDGDLSDPSWAQAMVIDEFLQVEPDTGAPATERTVLRIMYDENNLYFGVYAYDSQPDQIVVRSMARDGPLYTGDNISIVLDPGLTRRNAYSFQIGPSGGRGDALILNNSSQLDEWDPIWAAQARIVADGWVAEMAIPFRSLSYEAGQPNWGFDFSRNISRKNENIQWAVQNPALFFFDISQSGTLTGIANTNPGVGLDIQVYGVTHVKRDWHIPGEDIGISATAGGNAFYRITPALTGTLTFNPDFSDAPLDARQVNTTRFSLFFPETRDFFLQDAAAFEFGGRGFTRGFFDRSANNGRPFFSRNIGLVRREQVSILGGGKLSGTLGGFGIGALSVLTGDTPTSSGQVLSVARVTRPVLAESNMGVIFTNGDPTGATENTVAGADFQFRDSNWIGGGIFQSDMYYQRSFSSTRGEDDTFGVALNYPNEPWGGDFGFKEIGADYEPALGFVNRGGIRLYDGNLVNLQRFRDHALRTFEIGVRSSFVTDLRDRLESRESQISIEAETQSNDNYSLDLSNNYENVLEEFPVVRNNNRDDNVIIPAGRYTWSTVQASFRTSEVRALAFRVEVTCCSYYDGSGIETEFGLNYRPNEYYEIAAEWEASYFDMPGGKVNVHIVTISANVNFSPYMQIDMQAQYDNISEEFGFLSRYRWEFAPGDELFIALGQGAEIPDARFVAQRSLLSVRIGRTFRF